MNKVSCLCITYSRVNLLEEAIECFLRQTYKGPKELIIINDCDDQILHYDHPEVFILNSKNRFRTVGEKRNTSIALSTGDYFMHWDDDDIYLPHRIDFCMNKLIDNNLDYYKLNESFLYSMSNGISRSTCNQFYGCSIFSRDAYIKTTGHGFVNSGQDSFIEAQFLKLFKDKKINMLVENTRTNSNLTMKDLYYIYRWGGVSCHLSVTGKDIDPLNTIKKQRKASEQNRKVGDIQLVPHWDKDYISIVNTFIGGN